MYPTQKIMPGHWTSAFKRYMGWKKMFMVGVETTQVSFWGPSCSPPPAHVLAGAVSQQQRPAQGHVPFPCQSVQAYKGSTTLPQLRTTLNVCANCRAADHISWGLHATPQSSPCPPAEPCLSYSLKARDCWEHSLVNLTHMVFSSASFWWTNWPNQSSSYITMHQSDDSSSSNSWRTLPIAISWFLMNPFEVFKVKTKVRCLL